MNDTEVLQKFLEPYWETYNTLQYWEQDQLKKWIHASSNGWEKYGLYSGYGLCAYVWYKEHTESEFFTAWKPKTIMHELRKALKELDCVA